MTIVFQKSMLKSKAAKRIVADAKLTYFKEKVLEHLDRLERKEKKREQLVQKALVEAEALRKAAYPVGTIREWKGKKYVKTAPGKWRRKYDSDSRGAKQSIAAIKRKVDKCGSVEELLEVAKQNKHRFTDENGRYLPFVREMFDYVGKKHKEIKGANAGGSASSGAGKPKAGGSGGGDDGGGGDRTAKVFGHNYKEFKGKGKAAIEKLLETKNGYVKAAYHKEGIGDIDVVYGKVTDAKHHDGYGLAHILDKHPDMTPEIIDTVIQDGVVKTKKNGEGFNIVLKSPNGTGTYIVGIEKNFTQGKKILATNNWVITAFEKRESSWKSRNEQHRDNSKQNDVGLQNQLDNPTIPQTNGAVKQKNQNAVKRDTAKTPDELAQQFGLRGVEIDRKADPETAQWHVRKCADGFADIADITGIPDRLISLNGRLTLSIGECKKDWSCAQYDSFHEEITIHKKKGSGHLAHEWFHALDNLIMDAMGINKGRYQYFMTSKYRGLNKREAAALKAYLEAPEGSKKWADAWDKCRDLGIRMPGSATEEYQVKVAAAFDELVKAMTEGDDGQATAFLSGARKKDAGYKKPYYSETHEMAARAFSAYIKDKLAEQGRSNDYLTRDNNDERVYPQGEERKRINAAFDKLFRVIVETGAIRKAINAIAKRKSAESGKRWLWIDGDGKIWVKKSVMDAWKRAMAE